MRVGLSWDLSDAGAAEAGWPRVVSEIEAADLLGFDSAWVAEGRSSEHACSQPCLFLTFAARRTRNIHLRALARRVAGESAVRLAEEVSLLDLFSRGRGGVAYAAASDQGIAPQAVHETIEFGRGAWTTNEVRYRGQYVRFPAHTDDEAPEGFSYPEWTGEYVPQWEWGAAKSTADFLAVTPKPFATQVPIYVAIDDEQTLEWAARSGVSPFAGAHLSTEEAIEKLARYRKIAERVGRRSFEVDAVIERHVAIEGPAGPQTLGGTTHDIACAIREIAASTRVSHFVWRYQQGADRDLSRFANEVQTKLQA